MTAENEAGSGPQAIALEAVLSKIATTVDGGWNITLAADQSQIDSIMKLSALRDEPLQIAIVPFTSA